MNNLNSKKQTLKSKKTTDTKSASKKISDTKSESKKVKDTKSASKKVKDTKSESKKNSDKKKTVSSIKSTKKSGGENVEKAKIEAVTSFVNTYINTIKFKGYKVNDYKYKIVIHRDNSCILFFKLPNFNSK